MTPTTTDAGQPTVIDAGDGAELGLVTQALGKRFRSRGEETVALADVDLAAARGIFVSVIGPSGFGK
jgi:ABC-type glutathione transport system ATPase component